MKTDEDERALQTFLGAIEQAQAMDRHSVRDRATELFDTERIMADVVTPLNTAQLGWSYATAASV